MRHGLAVTATVHAWCSGPISAIRLLSTAAPWGLSFAGPDPITR